MSARPRPARGQKRAARFGSGTKRVSLQKKNTAMEGGGEVVKGVSRRIIVVDPPDPKVFERAIFIVREDFSGQQGVSESELLRQARQAAGDAMPASGEKGKLRAWVHGMLCAVAGAAAAALTWVMVQMAMI